MNQNSKGNKKGNYFSKISFMVFAIGVLVTLIGLLLVVDSNLNDPAEAQTNPNVEEPEAPERVNVGFPLPETNSSQSSVSSSQSSSSSSVSSSSQSSSVSSSSSVSVSSSFSSQNPNSSQPQLADGQNNNQNPTNPNQNISSVNIENINTGDETVRSGGGEILVLGFAIISISVVMMAYYKQSQKNALATTEKKLY